jgi:hypothetical protein
MWAVYLYVTKRECSRRSRKPPDPVEAAEPGARQLSASSTHFKLILSAVAALTLLALALSVVLALFADPSRSRGIAEACSTTYKMGFGALVGLVGRKAT